MGSGMTTVIASTEKSNHRNCFPEGRRTVAPCKKLPLSIANQVDACDERYMGDKHHF